MVDALIVVVLGGILSYALGAVISAAGVSTGPIVEAVIVIIMASLLVFIAREADFPKSLVNVIGLFGVAIGFSTIIGSFAPQAAPYLLGLGGSLTWASLVATLFYASTADWIGDKIGL